MINSKLSAPNKKQEQLEQAAANMDFLGLIVDKSVTKLQQLKDAVDFYSIGFEYIASTGTHQQLVEINSKLTTARLALYDARLQEAQSRYKNALETGEYL